MLVLLVLLCIALTTSPFELSHFTLTLPSRPLAQVSPLMHFLTLAYGMKTVLPFEQLSTMIRISQQFDAQALRDRLVQAVGGADLR